MYTVIYDVAEAPLVWPWITFLVLIGAVFACVLLWQYLPMRKSAARVVFYFVVGLLFVGAVTITTWSGVERRAICIAALENGRAQSIEGRLESFERVPIPGKPNIKETRFTVAGRSFVEPNISGQPCGFATRFTEAVNPSVGSMVRVRFDSGTVLRVEQKG